MKSRTGNETISLSTYSVDLSEVPVLDNHAHPLSKTQPTTPDQLRSHFSEAATRDVAENEVGSALYYRWAVRQLAAALEIEPTEHAILRTRGTSVPEYARELVRRAHLAGLLVDDGYPPPSDSYSPGEMSRMLALPVHRMLRIETLVQDLLPSQRSLAELADAFDAEIAAARRRGCVALKSIAAYRTGLRIEPVSDAEAEKAFQALPRKTDGQQAFRLASKPVIDYFVTRALDLAAQLGMPIQFHTGYGDPDLDLRLANPLHLRPLFQEPAWTSVPIVLLHHSFPYTAEAAFLCAVYPNAYLDMAFSLPPLGYAVLRRAVETALGTAPARKLMCSSDGTSIPEHYFLGAIRARQVVSDVLCESLERGEIDEMQAREMGRMALHENATRVYQLPHAAAPSAEES